jgi:uncharacterized cupin superfamily protein
MSASKAPSSGSARLSSDGPLSACCQSSSHGSPGCRLAGTERSYASPRPPIWHSQVVVPESELVQTEHGLVPKGQGWFVVNARKTQWWERQGRGVLCEFEGAGFEGATGFEQVGVNLTVLDAGEPMSMYHRENDQEDFLVLSGEALAIVEGEERPLRRWDFVHCPAGTGHVIIGAGAAPCVILAVGARDRSTGEDWGAYTVDEAAQRLGAGVERETTDAREAYARFARSKLTSHREGSLPD